MVGISVRLEKENEKKMGKTRYFEVSIFRSAPELATVSLIKKKFKKKKFNSYFYSLL